MKAKAINLVFRESNKHDSGSYPIDGELVFSGNSSWYLIQTDESFNGIAYNPGQGNFDEWFSSNAFGGTNYSNTPVGAASHTDEPDGEGNDSHLYFELWASGKIFASCGWNSIVDVSSYYNQEIGDPFTKW